MTALPALRQSRNRRSNSMPSALIAWQRQPTLWLGTLNGQIAGTVTRGGLTYRAVDWAGQPVGNFLTLRSAQRAFESIRIAQPADSLYGRSVRTEAVRSGVVSLGVIAAAATAGGLLINAPF